LHASVFDGDTDELRPGLRVEFNVIAGDRGRKAFTAHLLLPDNAPTLTGQQIHQVWQSALEFAGKHGWVDI
jgi:hypothetical protein